MTQDVTFRWAILFWFKHYRINFCDKLRFLLDPKYLPMEKIFIIESHKIGLFCIILFVPFLNYMR